MNRQRSKVSTCHSHTIKPYGFTHTISLTLDPYDRTCARSCVACAPVRPRPSPLTHQTPRSPPPPEGRDRAIVSCSALASALVTAYHLPQRISASVAVGAPPACNPTYPASSPVYPACNPLHLSSSAHQRISSGESLRLTNEGLCQPKRPRRTCAVRYTCGAVHARCSARKCRVLTVHVWCACRRGAGSASRRGHGAPLGTAPRPRPPRQAEARCSPRGPRRLPRGLGHIGLQPRTYGVAAWIPEVAASST